MQNEEEDLHEALLARLRLEWILAKFNTLQLERLGVALKHRLISVHQCVALQHDPTEGPRA